MGNSLKEYESRVAGLSPDDLRESIKNISINRWSGKALDIGMGRGGWTKHLVESKKFDSISGTDLLDCRDEEFKSINFHVANLASEKLNVPDSTYDFIFAIEVIEHIENPRFFMREIYRLLKPGGKFVMTTPSCDSLTSRISFLLRGYFPPFCESDYKGSGHITPITSIDFNRMCNEAGFPKVEESFCMSGRMPGSKITWQTIFPFLRGKLWCDSYFAICKK
jgi:SAM-dependent methyltransferase